ncbi:MAG: cytochrome c biogenesis protein CcsA [Candidatus Didemnitutus sp.]|nr:cytochrome c biogenesis protein CcsA [Candidatus Didemnitutus sp.]
MNSLLTDRSILWVGTLLYLAGFVAGCIQLLRKQHATGDRTLLNVLLAFGLATQTAGLYVRGLAHGGCPLGNQFEIVQFVAWSAMVLYFAVGPAFRVSLLGLFSSGYAASLAAISLSIPQWDLTRGTKLFGNNPWIEFHAALAVFSYGVFGLLALTSIMHLLQNWALKQKRLDGLFWFLPSVVQLDQINRRMLIAGVSLLTISLCVGASWWVRDTASVHWPKLLVTLSVWFVYTLALVLRWRGVLYAVRFSWACVILFMLAMMSLGPINANRESHRVELTPER